MKENRIATGLCLSALLVAISGCSKKPEATDIEASLTNAWSACQLVKPVDIKKTNGIDNGNSYRISIAYNLQITRDIAEEDLWPTKIPEPAAVPEINLNAASFEEIEAHSRAIKKAHEPMNAAWNRINDFYAQNCPEPASLEFQSLFGKSRETGLGRSLQKGESLEVTTEYTMVKSENGWIVQ
ncbi:hypothetical protein [Aquipseudomonas campi]